MKNYFVKRTIMSLVTLIIISFALFSLVRIIPGDPFPTEKLSQQQIEMKREALGLNDPVVVQYVRYIKNILKGDLGTGTALYNGAPIKAVLGTCIKNSFLVGGEAILLGVTFGILLGILAALNKGGFFDWLCSFISIAGICVPSYVFMILLQNTFCFKIPIFPILFDQSDFFRSTLLPSISLAFFSSATIARYTRNEMREVLKSDFVALAKSKGMDGMELIFKHVLRNALIPIITVIGPIVVGLLSGALVTEKIYGINGIGKLMSDAISGTAIDYNYVLILGMLYATLYIAVMYVLDILYGIVDPRIRLKGE